MNLVDYAADPAAARDTINAWVKRHTEDRIPKLLEPKDVTELTRLYLVNAIYMKAEWDQWFQDGETTPKTFTRLDGSTIKVPTMLGFRGGLGPIAPYATGDGWKAVELGYRGPTDAVPLAMTIVMPDDLKAFEKSLDAKTLASITAKLDKVRAGWYDVKCPPARDPGCYPYDLRLTMPKFSTETRTSLVKLLKGLGMPLAFEPGGADFGGIHVPSDPNDSHLHQCRHPPGEHRRRRARDRGGRRDGGRSRHRGRPEPAQERDVPGRPPLHLPDPRPRNGSHRLHGARRGSFARSLTGATLNELDQAA